MLIPDCLTAGAVIGIIPLLSDGVSQLEERILGWGNIPSWSKRDIFKLSQNRGTKENGRHPKSHYCNYKVVYRSSSQPCIITKPFPFSNDCDCQFCKLSLTPSQSVGCLAHTGQSLLQLYGLNNLRHGLPKRWAVNGLYERVRMRAQLGKWFALNSAQR